VAHALLLGLVKDFWRLMLRPVTDTYMPSDKGGHLIAPTAAQHKMSEKLNGITSVTPVTRALPDIGKYFASPELNSRTQYMYPSKMLAVGITYFQGMRLCRKFGSLTMADWLVFTDQLSPWITEDVGIDKQILAMWCDLRAAVVYYLRYRPGQEHPSPANDKNNRG
jgi:hypothetical protein